ncbi:B3 domain-containing protein REM5-like [Punica granatum]|uniref:B3 domain-containing protein REM5-like n=2 Tax=Punica granatum TaxID=22663 RepID=A0A6P8EQS5_PUNGR|nr:B3 domain-containing protein REM5-like [Punica granatum]XP_031407417.1 B3 domain-containing protein REM5-like [Punica granatum]XP_031407418.1 B3 domain-containing protein REM5-like [Punica granatum]XP_031407420.1 B3 domain-containing protein REM5-like [Punica granatum]
MPSPKKQTFFKIFLPKSSACRMKIPPAYRKHMKGKNSGAVYLKGPSGYYWRVKLIEESGNLYFIRGWPLFVKDHGIQLGYFLVFKFDGDKTFRVKVFNPTGCEDKAALGAKPSRDNASNPHNPGKELVANVEVEEDASWDRAEKAIVLAREPPSVTLPHFTIQIKAYHISGGGMTVGVPNSFVKVHLFHFVEQKTPIVLQWEDKEWPAAMTHGSTRTYIWGGWRDFVRVSKVQEGDICKFELVEQFVLRVHISRHIKEE